MEILNSIVEYYKVDDYAWIWKNATCNNETWVNQNTTIYSCGNATTQDYTESPLTLECNALYGGNTSCEFNRTYITGNHQESRNVDRYVDLSLTSNGKGNYTATSVTSSYDPAKLRITSNAPEGTYGKFSLYVDSAGTIGVLDPFFNTTFGVRRPIIIPQDVIDIFSINDENGVNGDYIWINTGNDSYIYSETTGFGGEVIIGDDSNTKAYESEVKGESRNPEMVWDGSVLMVSHNNDTSYKDSSMNQLTANVHGSPTVAPGVFGNALSTNGAEGYDYGNPPFAVPLTGTSDMAIEFWMKTTDSNADLVNNREGPGGHVPGQLAYGLFMIGGTVYWGHSRHNYAHCQDISTITVNDGAWHHIVGSFDGTTRNLTLYIDGVLDVSQICSSAIDSASQAFSHLTVARGIYPQVFSSYVGLMDEIRLYNRTVESDEVSRHYNNGISAYSTLGPEELPMEPEGFTTNTTTFDDGTETTNVTVPDSVRFVANPDANYSKASIKAEGLQGSPYPSNVVITVADKVVFTETGVFNYSVVIDMNSTRINEYLQDHPSGHVGIEVTGVDGVVQFSELEVSGTSQEETIFCNVDEYLDPTDNTCKEGSIFISSAKDKNRYTFSFGGNTSNHLSDDAFRWERENQSFQVTVSMDYQVNKHILEITETNARRIAIDFNTVSTLTGFNIFNSLSSGNRQDLSIDLTGDNVNDYDFIGIPKPQEVRKGAITLIEGTEYSYDDATKTLTITNLAMSNHMITFIYGSSRAMVQLAQIVAGIGGILLAMTLLMNTQITDPQKLIGNIAKIIVVIVLVVHFLGV